MKTLVMLMFNLVFFVNAHAFSCFITFVKDNCWTDYNVTLNVMNSSNGKVITSINVPQGKSWSRQSFLCEPSETISFTTTFSPAFWEKEADRVYNGQREWLLPQTIEKNDTAWNIMLCYTKDFSEVPLPPDANGNCTCDMKSIPAILPAAVNK